MSRFSNLQIRLTILVLLVAIPIYGLTYYWSTEERRHALIDTQNEALGQVREISVYQEQLIFHTHQILFALSQLSKVRDLDSRACSTILANLLKQSRDYTAFWAAKPGGEIFASAPPLNRPLNVSDRSYYRVIVQTGNFTIGDYEIGRVSRKPGVAVAYPVFEGKDKLKAILIAGLDLTWLNQFVNLANFPSGTAVTMIDKKGTILFRHPDPEKFLGKSMSESPIVKTILKSGDGVGEGYGLDKVKRIYGFTSLGHGSGDVYVSVGIPSEIAFAGVNKKIIRNSIWLGLTTFFTIMATWLIGNFVVRHPLNRLLGATQQLAQGDLSVRTGPSYASGEIGQLSAAFDQMADSLQSHEEELRSTEETLRESEEHYRRIIETAEVGIWMLDAEKITIFTNRKILQMLGYTPEEMKGKSFLEFTDTEGRSLIESKMQRRPPSSNGQYDFSFRRKDGTDLWTIMSISPIFDKPGERHGVLLMITDITERKKAEEQLKYMSLRDPLTGLYNRAYFEEGMKHLESFRFARVGIIMCDVDGLKLINDTLGHNAGDSILRTAADIIKECFRAGDVVARVGGDEFAVLLLNTERDVIETACRRMRHAISEHNSSHLDLPLSLSIGFAVRAGKSIPMNSLYKEADYNMYKEKQYRSQRARIAIVDALKKALGEKDFMTQGHMSRLRALTATFVSAIDIPKHFKKDLLLFAQFHDIGKVGIPDSILFKPAELTSGEYTEMKRHCEIGYRIAQSSADLAPIADLILKHHEWWNGKGYPLGLKEEEIPLGCRILAIADAYESMTGVRPYRKPMPHWVAIKELKKCAGTQFNPELVDKFVQVILTRKSKSLRWNEMGNYAGY
jgi:diguanylate cyclase (GGDEF)-like protein/PAS domain S-box-containing protein